MDEEEKVQQPLILISSVKLDSLRNDLTNIATRLGADITEIPNKATHLVMGQIAKWRLGSFKDREGTQERNIKGTKRDHDHHNSSLYVYIIYLPASFS